MTSIHLSPARQGGEPYAGVPRGREHPLGQGRGESPAREAPVSSRAEGRGSTRLYPSMRYARERSDVRATMGMDAGARGGKGKASDSSTPITAHDGDIRRLAQFLGVCSWLQLVYMGTSGP